MRLEGFKSERTARATLIMALGGDESILSEATRGGGSELEGSVCAKTRSDQRKDFSLRFSFLNKRG